MEIDQVRVSQPADGAKAGESSTFMGENHHSLLSQKPFKSGILIDLNGVDAFSGVDSTLPRAPAAATHTRRLKWPYFGPLVM